MSNDLLIEIGTEELPPKRLKNLAEAFAHNIQQSLQHAQLDYDEVKWFATPRRLAVLVHQLSGAQPDHDIEKRGPAVNAAFDKAGKPTKACEGFAKSCGTSVNKLERMQTDKGEWLVFRSHQQGDKTENLLEDIINTALKKIPVAKPMRWGDSTVEFVRPIHWVVILFGNKTVKANIFGINATDTSYGHRFLSPGAIKIKSPSQYVETLRKEGKVIVDFNERKKNIWQQIEKVANKKGQTTTDESLLDEITGMTSWPVALMGEFDKRFLDVPKEAVISAMKTHQRVFPVVNNDGELLPYFIATSNIESKNPKQIIAGNERVIRARLSDAEFFFQTDLKKSLEDHADKLKNVIFQSKLGTLHNKSERIAVIACNIAEQIGADQKAVARAAELCKMDLMTDMVGEFPELQGTMGYYYAKKHGESNKVAVAIKEQYMPSFSGDVVPANPASCCIAIADKIDSLVGLFGINQPPTGTKDPFALRRNALGILRIIIENNLALDLKKLLTEAQKAFHVTLENKSVVDDCLEFMLDRLKAWYGEQQVTADIFAAVRACRPTKPLDFHQRVLAVQAFKQLSEAESLAAANKRVSNILKKLDSLPDAVDQTLLQEQAEITLAQEVLAKHKEVSKLYQSADYANALKKLSTLQKPVDQFFDDVMVMTDDKKLRNNRLALLNNLRHLFLQTADISLLKK